MPNWCFNRLSVAGDPAALADFVARVTAVDVEGAVVPLRLEAVCPTPEWLKDTRSTVDIAEFFPAADFQLDPVWGPNQAGIEATKTRKPADWYMWRLSKWGTKWDLTADTEVTGAPDEGRVTYDFYSAWSPPVAWAVTASAGWPTLTFDLWYAEPAMDFAGRILVRNTAFAVDEIWDGREAHDQLKALGWDVYACWEWNDEEEVEEEESLPPLDEKIWVWDEPAGDSGPNPSPHTSLDAR